MGDYVDYIQDGTSVTVIVDDFIDDFWVNMEGGDDIVTVRTYEEMGSNGDLTINLRGGNNQARVVDCASRYLRIYTSSGNDDVTIEDCRADRLLIETNSGKDTVGLDGAFTSSGALIETGSGRDDVILTLGSANDADFEIYTGSGDDLVTASNFGGYRSGLIIETGEDQDRVSLDTGMIRGGLSGVNSLNIVGFEMWWIDVDLGPGDDGLANVMGPYTGDYLFNGGRGSDVHLTLSPPTPFTPAVSLAIAPWAMLNFEHTVMLPTLQATTDPLQPGMIPFRP